LSEGTGLLIFGQDRKPFLFWDIELLRGSPGLSTHPVLYRRSVSSPQVGFSLQEDRHAPKQALDDIIFDWNKTLNPLPESMEER